MDKSKDNTINFSVATIALCFLYFGKMQNCQQIWSFHNNINQEPESILFQ